MIFAFLLTVLPTILFYIVISKIDLKIESKYLKISLSWFLGQYIFTTCVFLLCLLLSNFTSDVLLKSSWFMLFVNALILIYFHQWIETLGKMLLIPAYVKSFFKPANLLLVLFCFLFSYFFFIPHLSYQDETINRSPIYWDFHWHAALIQNFTIGDNFPPVNEAFSGVIHSYHYLWGVMVGIYDVLGLSLVDSINFYSIISFFFILITLIGLSDEFFKSKAVGFIIILLTLTSSSFHFIDYLKETGYPNWFDLFRNIITNNQHPWTVSFTNIKHSFFYNGTFYNLFYFVEERQIIIAMVYLLLCIFVLSKIKSFSSKQLVLIGAVMGGYFLWHLHITIMVLLSVFFILIFGSDRKKTLYLLGGFLVVFASHIFYFKYIIQSSWFLKDTQSFPKINLGFSDQENKPFSLMHASIWYLYSYGLKVILFPAGIIYLIKRKNQIGILLLAIFLPTFLLLNTIQLSPGSIYENHKWLRPMNFAIDIAVGLIIYVLFFKKKNIATIIIGITCIALVTFSGFIELMPFINSRPVEFYSKYPSAMTYSIAKNSNKKASFVGTDEYEIQLSGRKLFLGDVLGGGLGLDMQKRREIINDIYASAEKSTFCNLTKSNFIDFVEYDTHQKFLPQYLNSSHNFSAINNKQQLVIFVDVKKTCGS